MISRLVKIQLVAFFIIAVVGITYVGARYAKLDHLLGLGTYQVEVQLADSGGIFTNSEVTYRGVPVGQVGALSLGSGGGVNVALKLNDGGPRIPASAVAVVANRSAVGEQYVDLRPDTDQGPYLVDGSKIAQDRTEIPVPLYDLLAGADTLTRSVPVDSLRTVVSELGKAFDGRGQDLQTLFDSVGNISQEITDTLPQTVALVRDGGVVLGTQAEQAPAIASFSRDLRLIAVQLQSSNPDLRTLIDTGLEASDAAGSYLSKYEQPTTALLANGQTITSIIEPRAPGLGVALAILPATAQAAPSLARGGVAHFGLVLETNNPPACTVGYESTRAKLDAMKAQDPNFDEFQSEFPLNLDAHCDVPQGSPTGVRGAARAILSDPDYPQPWDNKPKVDPDRLNLTPVATQMYTLLTLMPAP